MKCPWCKTWEGEPKDYLEHLKTCPKYASPFGTRPNRTEKAQPRTAKTFEAFKYIRDRATLSEIKHQLQQWEDIRWEKTRGIRKTWTKEELLEVIDAFGKFIEAVQYGVPHEMFDFFVKKMDRKIGMYATIIKMMWPTPEDVPSRFVEYVEEFKKCYPKEWDRAVHKLEAPSPLRCLEEATNIVDKRHGVLVLRKPAWYERYT